MNSWSNRQTGPQECLLDNWCSRRQYLRFIWQGQTYQFQALPFGLCTVPRVFRKLLKPVIAFLRTRNVRPLIYLDDILIVGSDINVLQDHTNLVLKLLQSL